MKEEMVFKQFKYSIPSTVNAMSDVKKNHIVVEHLPIMQVVIDFEKGRLKLSGCWHFMIANNRHNTSNWFNYHRDRVEIETTLYGSSPIDLSDPEADGLVFAMDGEIKDGDWINSCSGLVILDKVAGYNGSNSVQWVISFYLYDLQYSDYEIKFKLPVYLKTVNEMDN